ncbi:MAG: hypothetical protein AAF843_17115 [Bacteroidota bacterium]
MTNYTGIDQNVKYTFYQNDNIKKRGSGKVVNVLTDSVIITPNQPNDTTLIAYRIETENGFSDGELREIPVFEKGIHTVSGHFRALDSDTAISINFADSLGAIKLYASGDVKNVFLDEIQYLINYKYECNEQLASKLMALATSAYINKGLNTDQKKKVTQTLRKLKSRQNDNGLWGWWAENYFEPWVTEHVVKSLKSIEPYIEEEFNYEKTIDNVIWEVDKTRNPNNKLELISILKLLNPSYDISFNLQEVKVAWKTLNTIDKLTYWQLEGTKQTYLKDSVMHYAEYDGYGNLYFINKTRNAKEFYRENIYVTLKAYELLNALGETELTRKIMNYLLHKRTGLHWRNTYESSKIISVLRTEISSLSKVDARLTLKGIVNKTIDEFPLSQSINRGGTLNILKTGRAPVYVTAYQQMEIDNPSRNSEYFNIYTKLNGVDSLVLTAGKPVDLEVRLEAKANAEFLVLDIPIPASCSYAKKEKPYNETHREYYRDKVSIFFKKLSKGTHTYNIKLIPRFSGTYTQNPAQAHWMYFPTISGWNESKRIRISNH